MKYCSKCGKELSDEAEICMGCGCMVQSTFQRQGRVKASIKMDKETVKKLVVILNFVFTITVAFCVFSLLLSVCNASVSSYSSYYYRSSYFAVDKAGAIWAFLFSFATLGLSVTSLVFNSVKKMGRDDFFSSISRVVIGLLLWIVSLVFMVS